MPKTTRHYKVIRGFDYTPKGAKAETRVDAGGKIPADLTDAQLARLAERGILVLRHKGDNNG